MESLPPGTLHMLCGKIAAGKSTLAALLAEAHNAVMLSEDQFLARLYPYEIQTIDDYARCATRLRRAVEPHIVELLRRGVSVVLDFQANTQATRAWMRNLFESADAKHQLHYLEVSDETCKARLRTRNASRTHEYQVSDAEYELFTRYFVPPAPDEGFTVVAYQPN